MNIFVSLTAPLMVEAFDNGAWEDFGNVEGSGENTDSSKDAGSGEGTSEAALT